MWPLMCSHASPPPPCHAIYTACMAHVASYCQRTFSCNSVGRYMDMAEEGAEALEGLCENIFMCIQMYVCIVCVCVIATEGVQALEEFVRIVK